MLRLVKGPWRPSQADLENMLEWQQRSLQIRRHMDRLAPRLIQALEVHGAEVLEPGPNVAVVEPVVEIGGVRYRTLRVNGSACYCLVEGELRSIENAVCLIRGASV